MHPLYPAIKPYQIHELAVSSPHVLYVEETGNPAGIPVIALHPGPGAGSDTQLRRFFDPELYRIILFDQRGCGQSTPHLELQGNNTQSILADIERIREFLQLRKFILFGGGWGCLLALLYAEKYPQHISALLLQQIFLGRRKEIDWFFQYGTNQFFPDFWQEFVSLVPIKEQHKVLQYYITCLQGENDVIRMAAAKCWGLWQARCSSLQPHLSVFEQYSDPHFALSLAIIESYYIKNHYFIEENQVLENISAIQHLPIYLIHGRYDMICPLETAWELHKTLLHSNLRIVEAGHSDREIGMIDAIIDVSKTLAKQSSDAS